MGKKIEVQMHCLTGKGEFLAIFEEKNPEEWYWIDSKMVPRAPEKKTSFLSKIGLSFGKKEKDQPKSNATKPVVRGMFYLDTGRCPYCESGSFIQCSCGEYTCLSEEAKISKCFSCGNTTNTEDLNLMSEVSANSVNEEDKTNNNSSSNKIHLG